MHIIPTIKKCSKEVIEASIHRFGRMGMKDFRYVLNKDDIQEQIEFVLYFQHEFESLTGKSSNIFFDIPCPKDKERIQISSTKILQPNEIITLGTSLTDIIVDFLPKRTSADLVRIGNSEALFEVIACKDDVWTLQACFPCEISSGMPIASSDGFIIQSNEELFQRSEFMIKSLAPECLILSYVEDNTDVNMFKQYGIKIMSKIETMRGIRNVKSIKDNSDAIFVARGCLGVNVGFENLFQTERTIIKTFENADNIYIGSNILRSLGKEEYPTRSDCCELASLVDMGYNNFIITDGFSMYDKLQTFMFVLNRVEQA